MSDISTINDACSKIFDQPLDLAKLFNERIDELGITANFAYKILGLDKKSVEPILDGSAKIIDVFNLIKISEFVGLGDAGDLIRRYVSSSPSEKIDELAKVRKAVYISRSFDLESLKKAGFFSSSIHDFEAIEQRILKFFKLDSIFDYQKKIGVAFMKSRRQRNNHMLEFWVGSADYQFRKINNPNPYDRELFKDIVGKIRPYTTDEKHGLYKVSRALYAAGVTVIAQPHLPTTQVHGATFIINDKPCIVITDLNKRYSYLWFALLHEIFHCLFDFDSIKKMAFHLSGEPDILLGPREDEANRFAEKYLFPQEKLSYIQPLIQNPTLVEHYARVNEVHPSIIYDFHCRNLKAKKGVDHWHFFQKYQPTVSHAIKDINIQSFDYESLEESVVTVKNNLELKLTNQ